MMLPPRWRKVTRDLWRHKSRTLLVILSIATGVFAFGGLFMAREISIADLMTQYTDSHAADVSITLPPFDDDLVRWAAQQDSIVRAQGEAVHNVEMIADGHSYNLTLHGFERFDDIQVNCIEPHDGKFPPGLDELVLERSFLKRISAELGDTVTIQLGDGEQHHLTLVGTVHDMNVFPGTIQSQLSGYVTLRTLHRIGLPAQFNHLLVTVGQAHPDVLGLTSPADSLQIAEWLRERLRHMNMTPLAMNVNQRHEHWAADTLRGLSVIFVIVGFASLALSGFLVVNIISSLLVQQRRQIGIMKVVGASREQIAVVYLVMVASFGVIALVIAIPASLLLASRLVMLVGPGTLNFDVLDFHMPTYVLVMEIATALLVPLLAALTPIFNGTRVTAAQAISDYAVPSRHNLLDLMLIRLRGLPRPFLLALRNAFRHKSRLLTTIVTLALAGAFFMSIVNVRVSLHTFVDNLLHMSGYDVQIFLSHPYNQRGIEQRLLQIPGVVAVEGWAVTNVRPIRADGTEGESFTLYGLRDDSPFVVPPLHEGRWLAPMDNFNRYDIVVSRGFLQEEPVHVGDTLTLRRGDKDEDWHIVGVVDSFRTFTNIYGYYDTVAHFDNTYPQAERLLIRTTHSDSAFQKNVAEAVVDYLDLRDIYTAGYTIGADLKKDIGGTFDIVIVVLLGMSALVALVAGLGLAGTMSINVMERTREIGVMRSVGASTSAIRQIFLGEGVIIGLMSFVLALPLVTPFSIVFGRVLGQAMLDEPLDYMPTPLAQLIWLVIVLLVAGAASLSPAQRASQISIREALAYE